MHDSLTAPGGQHTSDAEVLTFDIPDAALERAAATHPGGAEGAMSFPNAPTVSILVVCCSFDGSQGR